MKDKNFYKDLKSFRGNIINLFKEGTFVDIPGNWSVIISDVKNSTAAVNAGNHNDVNLVAAGSLIVALNIARIAGIEIPFFFTGDGGTVFVPNEILKQVLDGLKAHNNNSIKNFGLELHIGYLPVSAIREKGHILRIAKLQTKNSFSKAVVIGDGLKYSEEIIKGASQATVNPVNPLLLNMEGLECRWDKIKPPADQKEVVCYIIEAVKPQNQIEVYREVLQVMEDIFGSIEERNPLSLEKLRLLLSVNKFKKEMLARVGRWKASYFTSAFLNTFLGYLYFKLNLKINNLKGRDYLRQVVNNADILTIDGRISTVISSNSDKIEGFKTYLNREESKGKLLFGHYSSKESIMTCYIENRNDNHIHFVDGADGGYTQASKELKQKMKSQNFPV